MNKKYILCVIIAILISIIFNIIYKNIITEKYNGNSNLKYIIGKDNNSELISINSSDICFVSSCNEDKIKNIKSKLKNFKARISDLNLKLEGYKNTLVEKDDQQPVFERTLRIMSDTSLPIKIFRSDDTKSTDDINISFRWKGTEYNAIGCKSDGSGTGKPNYGWKNI